MPGSARSFTRGYVAVRTGRSVWSFRGVRVYDAVAALGATYDVVYTGIGALNWLPDVGAWASVVSALLRPGGRLYLREVHPMTMSLPVTMDAPPVWIEFGWFQQSEPLTLDGTDTYVGDGTPLAATRTHEWNRGLAEVVTAVLDAGLTLTALREHDFCDWQAYPWMVETAPGADQWVFPPPGPRIPFEYTVEARKPS